MNNTQNYLKSLKFSENKNKNTLYPLDNNKICKEINDLLELDKIENISFFLKNNKNNILGLINNSYIRKYIMKENLSINEFLEIIGIDKMVRILKNYDKSYNTLFKSLFRKRKTNEGIIDIVKKRKGSSTTAKVLIFNEFDIDDTNIINNELNIIITETCFINFFGLLILDDEK